MKIKILQYLLITVSKTIKVALGLLVLVTFISFASASHFTEGLVAWWRFDEATGDFLSDSSNNSNNGTLAGNPAWSNDSIAGHALTFDGINDKVNVVKTSSVDIVDNVTIEVFIKRNAFLNDEGTIISKNGPYFLAVRNTSVVGGVYANDGNCPSSCTTPGANTWTEVRGNRTIPQGKWARVKLVYNGANLSLHVNGEFVNSSTKKGQMPQVSQLVHMGWGEPGHNHYFNGIIDELRIYNISMDADMMPEINLSFPRNNKPLASNLTSPVNFK